MSELISAEYLDQLHKMRSAAHKPRWGAGGQRHAMTVHAIINQHRIASVVDYGCGHGMLIEELLKLSYRQMPTFVGYDPGIPERSMLPRPAELVMSTDVLEHVEPDKLDGVLRHIATLAERMAYLNIHTGPANAILPDGRNAHLIQQPAAWWQAELGKYFSKVERVKGFDDRRPSFLCE